MAGNPNQFHHPYIPPQMLQLAFQQKYGQHPHNPAPPAWMPKYLDTFYGNRYANNVSIAHLRMGMPVNSQLRMAVPNATIGGQANRSETSSQTSRKRQRTSGSPHETMPKPTDAKKQRLKSESPLNSKNEPSTSTSTPDSHKRTSSPVQEDVISAAVEASYANEHQSSPKPEPKVLQDKPSQKQLPGSNKKNTSSVSSSEILRTSNSASEKKPKNSEHSTTDIPSSSSSHLEQSKGVVTPQNVGRKRKAGAASLANSAPPAVKVKHARIQAEDEVQIIDLTETPTSSKQANNQRRNSLPAPVKDTLAEQILQRYHETKQQDVDLHRKEDLRIQLENTIHEVMPFTMLFLVGSSRNCFGTRTSDADMCLMVTDGEMNQKRDAKNILYQLRDYLRGRCHFMRQIQVIPAKVPIIKFRHKYSGIECDLNINNATGIRNTYLLQAYAKLDYRVAPLVLMVKQWASHCKINDASQSTLSSYSLVLMVLNYLQVHCKPPVIPSLQQRYSSTFNNFGDVRQYHTVNPSTPLPHHIRYQSENKQDVGALLRGFFDYYANKFDFNRGVISVRSGKVLSLNQVRIVGGDWTGKYIYIEEPFDGTNTARAVYREDKFRRITNHIRHAHDMLRNSSQNLKIHKVIGEYSK